MTIKIRKKEALIFSVIIGLGLILRLAFALNMGSVDGDTAVFGLMAKHILELREFPAYMVLLHYAGSLVSYIGAVLFMLFGVSSTVFNLVGFLFSSLWVILIFFMAKELLNRFGCFIAVILAALPFYYLLHYSLLTGQYGEALFFMLLLLFIFIRWVKTDYENETTMPLLLGLCCSITFWVTLGAVPALMTIATVMFSHYRNRPFYRVALFFLAGFLIGYIPAIMHNLHYPSATMFRMAGKTFDVGRGLLLAPDPAGIIFKRILWKISVIPRSFFLMPGLMASLIGLPAAALFIISLAFVVKSHGFNRRGDKDIWYMLCIYTLWFVVFHIILVQAPRERYMTPICTMFPVFIGYMISRFKPRFRTLGITLISTVLLYNSYTVARAFPDKGANRFSALAGRLSARGLRYGFSDYYTGYIAQFETQEKSIISPTLFHPTFSDRWPEETAKVRSAPDIFYVIDKHEYSERAQELEERCKERGITYKKEDVKGFEIYYGFSSKIYPEELPVKNIKEDL